MRSLPLLALLLALPLPAAAAPAKGLKAYVFISSGAGSEAEVLAGRLEGVLTSALGRTKEYALIDPSTVVGGGAPKAAKDGFRRAAADVEQGKKFFKDGKFEEAEGKFRAARAEFEKLLPWVEPDEWTTNLAMIGASAKLRGKELEAKAAFSDLATFDSEYAFEKLKLEKGVNALWREARSEVVARARGELRVVSTPGGARVYVDGSLKGYAPVAVDRLAAGQHLVQVDRPGFETFGELVELAPAGEKELRAKLRSTTEGPKVQKAIREIIDELRQAPGPTTLKVGTKLKLDRAVFGVASIDAGKGAVELYVVDFARGVTLARRSENFDGGEHEDADRDLRRIAKDLLAEASRAGSGRDENGDPLDRVSGTEDWSAKAGRDADADADVDEPPPPEKPRKGGDPLEHRDGMEDW